MIHSENTVTDYNIKMTTPQSSTNISESAIHKTITKYNLITCTKYLKKSNTLTNKSECRYTKLGETYTGTVHYTALGYMCEHWVNVNQTIYKDEDFPDESMEAAVNFCRNPDTDSAGIWCYTDFENDQYDYCNSPYCANISVNSRNCKTTRQGSDYTGNISHTIQGFQCQAWHKQTPNIHNIGIYDYEFSDNDVYAAGSSCRNPDNDEEGPWC